MKLFLNEKLETIFVLKELDTMISDMINDPRYNSLIKDIDSIDLVRATIDPVQVFLDYWVVEVNTEISEERQQYIKNALYAVKGSPEVFNVFNRCFELSLMWEYEYPVIKVFSIESIELSSVSIFESKIKYLFYHLLYYIEINIYIRNLIYKLIGELINYRTVIKLGFNVVETYIGDENESF
jgi:hypothetical protein